MIDYSPPCGNLEPHMFHQHEWMDHHFKMHLVWCPGLCDCGMSDCGPHGPGEHK